MCCAVHNMLHLRRSCHPSRSQDGDLGCDLDHTQPNVRVPPYAPEAQKLKTVTLGNERLGGNP
jgi:hypothetical protein